MFGNRFLRIMIGVGLFSLGVFRSALWSQPSADTKNHQSQTIVKVGDYVITVKELEEIIKNYPERSLSSREAKRRLVESLISTKLFSLAARTAKLDAAADFPKAKEKARENTLIYAYFVRTVKPKFSEEEARKYFEMHKDVLVNFSYSRNGIIELLKDQALTETNQALMQEWRVKQRDDVLKDLDLRKAEDPSIVLAQIGPEVVTVGDWMDRARLYEAEGFSTFRGKKELLEILVLERLYRLAAEKAGLVNDPEVQKALQWSEDNLLGGQYRQLVEEKVTMEDARRYYQAHPDEFKRSDQLRLQQVVVATEAESQKVLERLNKGEMFEQVAKTSSTDRASAVKGGDIGWVRQGRLHPEVEKVVFQMKPKQISPPITTPQGYVIVRVEERLEGKLRPFDEVAPNVLTQLQTRAVEVEGQRLMKVYKVTINERLL